MNIFAETQNIEQYSTQNVSWVLTLEISILCRRVMGKMTFLAISHFVDQECFYKNVSTQWLTTLEYRVEKDRLAFLFKINYYHFCHDWVCFQSAQVKDTWNYAHAQWSHLTRLFAFSSPEPPTTNQKNEGSGNEDGLYLIATLSYIHLRLPFIPAPA